MSLAANFPIMYKPSIASRILMAVFGLIILVPVAIIGMQVVDRHHMGVAPIVLLLGVFGIAIFWQALVGKVILYRDHIELVSLIGTRSLTFSQIKGRKRRVLKGNSYIVLFPADEKKPLSIPSSYRLDDTFSQWIAEIPDLDAVDDKAVEDAIAKDTRYGFTPEEKKAKVASLQRTGRWISFLFIPIILWVALYPYPVWLVVGIALLMPWIAIALTVFSGGLYSVIEFDKKALRMKGNLSTLIMIPVYMLFIIGTKHGPGLPEFPMAWQQLLLPAVVIGVAMTALIAMISQGSQMKWSTSLIVFAFFTAYGGCATGLLNSLLDQNDFKTFELTIANKHNTTGKGASYWLDTINSSDISYDGPLSLKVAPSFYSQVNVNQKVCAHMHAGAFGMRWEDISSCNS